MKKGSLYISWSNYIHHLPETFRQLWGEIKTLSRFTRMKLQHDKCLCVMAGAFKTPQGTILNLGFIQNCKRIEIIRWHMLQKLLLQEIISVKLRYA